MTLTSLQLTAIDFAEMLACCYGQRNALHQSRIEGLAVIKKGIERIEGLKPRAGFHLL